MFRHPRYEVIESLGKGGTSRVFRVRDREASSERAGGALVAKVLEASVAADALEAEFALLSRLRIPGLVRAHDFGRDDGGAAFLVEDYVAAVAHDSFAQQGDRAKAWLIDVLVTLVELHDAGFVHGDIKPAHVRLQADGRSILVDLGSALELRSRDRGAAFSLTPAYAAPEVSAGAPPDVRADLFSLGMTFFALIGAPLAEARNERAASRSAALRRVAHWLAPSVAEIVASLLAPHPVDRPADARSVLALLGRAGVAGGRRWEDGGFACVGREPAIAALLSPKGASVRWLVGPSGAGKSHALREAALRALAAGIETRVLRFPLADGDFLTNWIAHLRSDDAESPFVVSGDGARPLFVVLDDLHRAPAELLEALDAFQCRRPDANGLWIAASTREPPKGARAIAIGALDAASFATLCAQFGVEGSQEIDRLARLSASLPGWLVAAVGKVPLSRDSALGRLASLSEEARFAAFALAIHDGSMAENAFERVASAGAFAEIARSGLGARQGSRIELGTPHLADDLVVALASFERTELLGSALLREVAPPARALLRTATADTPPGNRTELLRRAVERAAQSGERQEEIDALFALASVPAERTAARVLRLERLTRDSGQSRTHPEVLRFLDDVAKDDPVAAALTERRRAELAARDGRTDEARSLAEAAVRASPHASAIEGYAWATEGAVALYRGDYPSADRAFLRAREILGAREALGEPLDREELARLDHNHGIVALARGRVREAATAFARSLAKKRALGDRAGVRSCLLNLGLARAKLCEFDDAAAALDEAIRLAKSLGQVGGLAWCLAARADLAVRRGDAAAAASDVAEAAALGETVPPVVRADLAILRSEIALVKGDGAGAFAALRVLDETARAGDSLTDARALVIEARAHLASLPSDRRAAARLAIRAIRRARAAALDEAEAAARSTLSAARGKIDASAAAAPPTLRYDSGMLGGALPILEAFARGEAAEVAIRKLLADVRAYAGAERAFLVGHLDRPASARLAFGVDVDDEPIADAARKLELDDAVAEAGDTVRYQRELATRAGRGSRLVSIAANTALVLEHRFRTSAFDALDGDVLRSWNVVGGVLMRGSSPIGPVALPVRSSSASEESLDVTTTVVPARERRREFTTILGSSPALARALAKLDGAIDSDLPVVLSGETGTGKELFARALHDYGRRASRPFVAVNCAAIADALFEAELFGHARGAFTGADRARPGLLARAEGGTLFLDEIGELSLARQATLLRALETRMLRPVGSDDERPFDVRVVCATHRDLDEAVRQGQFRADLLFRLRVLAVEVPALRDREDDILVLARAFLRRAGSRAAFTKPAEELVRAYEWPGNVRELAHVCERLATLEVDRVEARHLPRALRARRPDRPTFADDAPGAAAGDPKGEIERALSLTNGNISHAASALGLTRQGLKKKMVRLGLRKKGA